MTGRVVVYSAQDAVVDLRRTFELEQESSSATLIAAALRRLCSFMCPCPGSAIVRIACRSLEALALPVHDLRQAVEAVLEDMVVCGDLLELAHMAISGGENHPSWLYCAPPSFVVRRGGRIHIFGIAADDAAFLPTDLRSKLRRREVVRYLEVSAADGLPQQLQRLGLREVNEAAWMTAVSKDQAQQFAERYKRRLTSMGVTGELPDLTILLPRSAAAHTYSARWQSAKDETGLFIGRVPQPYGAPLWYFCSLKDGAVLRSLLLPLKESTDRASDAAWRLQLALDAASGAPASCVARISGDQATLTFDIPIPTAARRRLLFLGAQSIERAVNPFRYELPVAELESEQSFLLDHYWIECRAEETQ